MSEERKIYMEKKDIVHTPEEILAAFEDNTAIVFELSSERTPSSKSNLFGGILQINPEAIEENWGAIDLWYTSNFDGVVHVYEIVDNYNESVCKYPSDHLPAKLYVTLYTK